MTNKARIREALLVKRRGISIIENAELSARVSERLLRLNEVKSAKRLLCYASVRNEVETVGLIRQLMKNGAQVYLPRIRSGRGMDAVRVTSFEALNRNRFGIPEPTGDEIIDPAALDVALVPGVGFDHSGRRLGYGAGYFDKYLAKCACPLIGLAFEMQRVEILPEEEHDVRMHIVVTENAVYDNREGLT